MSPAPSRTLDGHMLGPRLLMSLLSGPWSRFGRRPGQAVQVRGPSTADGYREGA